ncbi:hypothetical protein BC831DRAFT_227914 [Entophlyctis helioformis]|nr:hypothetical protein BC831DRAFT_227914 [Entophlyctis helioformis]
MRPFFVPVVGKSPSPSPSPVPRPPADAQQQQQQTHRPAVTSSTTPSGRQVSWAPRGSSLKAAPASSAHTSGGSVLADGATGSQHQQSALYEERIADNLTRISAGVSGLRELALGMSDEMDKQKGLIAGLDDKVSVQTERVYGLSRKVETILEKT